MPTRPTTFITRCSRLVRRHRRPVAAALAGCAALLAMVELRPTPPNQQPVLVAAHDLAAGTVITADDVQVSSWPTTWPGAITSTSAAVGRAVAVPVPARAPLTSGGLVQPDSLGGRARQAGRVVMAVRLSDPGMAALLRAGDLVDVWAAGADALTSSAAAARVAAGARVLTVPVTGSGPLAAGSAGGLVVLAVEPSSVAALARATASARLTVSVLPSATS